MKIHILAVLSLMFVGCVTPAGYKKVEYPDHSEKAKVWVCDIDSKDSSKLECFESGPIFAYVCNLPQFVHGK